LFLRLTGCGDFLLDRLVFLAVKSAKLLLLLVESQASSTVVAINGTSFGLIGWREWAECADIQDTE